MSYANPTDQELRTILTQAKTIAIVGASSNPERSSYGIMKKLQSVGYTVIPVNPRETEVLGERAYASLADIPVPVDIVDVFRRSEDTPAIADEAVAIKAKVPVVPIAISGSREIMPPERLAAASGEIRIRIDPPIATEKYSVKDREMLKEKVREAISRNFELISKT